MSSVIVELAVPKYSIGDRVSFYEFNKVYEGTVYKRYFEYSFSEDDLLKLKTITPLRISYIIIDKQDTGTRSFIDVAEYNIIERVDNG